MNNRIEKVVDTIRRRRGPAAPVPTETPHAAVAPASAAEIEADVPQLHLSATVAKAAADDE